jgi:3-hydroxybutyryl-CoA dehydrogenase
LIDLTTIAVIGAGPLGRRLALLCSRAGYRTILEDVLPSNLRKAGEHLEEISANGQNAAERQGKVEFAGNMEDAVRDADLIVDCVPDELESKLEIFSLLDRMAPPRSILATPTRALSIADLASCTYRAERCVALELPPELLGGAKPDQTNAVTVVHSSGTLPEVLDAVIGFLRRLGLEVASRADASEPAPG